MARNVYKVAGSGLLIPRVTTDPASLTNGMLWYNTTENVFKKYENGEVSVMSVADVSAAVVTYDNQASGLLAENVQDAIDEVDSRVDELETLTPLVWKGNWDASTNTPALADGGEPAGSLYRVATAGTQDLGSGPITFAVGDKVVSNGTIWEKWDTTDEVSSVNGHYGDVVLDSDDVDEGSTNLYFTDARAKTAAVLNTLAGSETDQAPSVASVKTALSSKMEELSDDTTPSLGGDLSTGTNKILHDSSGLPIGTAANETYLTKYAHEISLSTEQTNTPITALSFAAATYAGCEITYIIKESTTNRVKIGTLLIANNGTDVGIVDVGTETADVGVEFDVTIDSGTVNVVYTTPAGNSKTMRAISKLLMA